MPFTEITAPLIWWRGLKNQCRDARAFRLSVIVESPEMSTYKPGKVEDAMTVKQLIQKLQHPPCERIAAVRIEFADGGICEVSPDTRRISPSKRDPLKVSAITFSASHRR